ncbi:MAG: TfoX/Sxy family protein [Pirellulaceae bacterium]|jgi:TfoX/Sxy family transcriptional regulator of competence genes|nr:TfoX/Sxy family protein [Pirellulaceae bacterium]
MPYSQALADRVRAVLGSRRGIVAKKMFGALGFMQSGNFFAGVAETSLIVRLAPEVAGDLAREPYAAPFAPTGKPMRGWLLIEADGLDRDDDLRAWIERALEFVATLPPK